MALFTKESLDTLRQRVDLLEVIKTHVEMKPAGSAYKGLCPFHDEKTPSFVIQRGDTHYHCFGCGAHGDAIQFMMTHQQLSFVDAIETLAQQSGVLLEKTEEIHERGPSRKRLKETLDAASRFYQYLLLHTEEGHRALDYLYNRGIDLDFIKKFRIGIAPKEPGLFRKAMLSQKFSKELLVEAGLAVERDGGRLRDFFYDRITFPICDATGAVIGFSARKYKEDTFGGKYVNTSETSLFKKWRVLFGLHHCRRRIAKEKTAVVVEGQVDALRLIQEGLDITVAGQGTAFGDGHVEQLLQLGVQKVILALDGDNAGREAAAKIGRLFQKEGVDVKIVAMGSGEDPDTFLGKKGIDAFVTLLDKSDDYLSFLIHYLQKDYDISTPAGKNALVAKVAAVIREWNDPVMVHESLRRLAQLTGLPEQAVGVGQEYVSTAQYRRNDSAGGLDIDPDCILEMDFLRWLVLAGEKYPHLPLIAQENVKAEMLQNEGCRKVYTQYLQLQQQQEQCDITTLANSCDEKDSQEMVGTLLSRKVNMERMDEHFEEAVQRILDREWLEARDKVRRQITSGDLDDDQAMVLAKEFDDLKRNPPKVNLSVGSEEQVRDCAKEKDDASSPAFL